MRVLDLFSGIGGFSVGLERAGMRTVAFCEIDPFCRRVLAKHWPSVPCYDDVRTLTADTLWRDGVAADVIAGGFPCQDISVAGKRAGLEGARSGLWGEYRRLIGEVRPGYVIVENVPGLLSLGMGTVLGDLSALGYDAVWDCIPASALGAPHRRDRIWIIAHTTRDGRHARGQGDAAQGPRRRELGGGGVGSHVRNANVSGLAFREGQSRDVGEELSPAVGAGWWSVEPDVGRVANGVPARVDRLRSLGNAIVPQISELLGRVILETL